MQLLNLIKPIASVRKLAVMLNLASDLPEYAVGDEKRLMQTLLNIVGNAVKFSKEGSSISVSALVARSETLRDPHVPEFFPVLSDDHFYLRVLVGYVSNFKLLIEVSSAFLFFFFPLLYLLLT